MTTYTVQIPRPDFSCKRLGVTIYDGVGQTDDPRIARRLRDEFGYEVTPAPPSEVTLLNAKGSALTVLVEREVLDLLRAFDLEKKLPASHKGIFTFADAEEHFKSEVTKRRKDEQYADAPKWPWEGTHAETAQAAKS